MACHTPKGPRGREFANKLGALAAPSFRDPGGVSVSRNITSSKTNGIGGWTDDEIKRAITQASARMAASSIRPWASTTTPQCQLPTSTPSSPICVRCRQKRIVPKPLCHAFAGQSVFVQVFGRRHDEPFHALWRPASKKRQGTKSRTYAGAEPRALWGFCRRFGLAEVGLKRSPRSACAKEGRMRRFERAICG